MGFGVGGKLNRNRIYMYLQLTHVVQQKPTQHCKAIILQKKKKKNKKTQNNKVHLDLDFLSFSLTSFLCSRTPSRISQYIQFSYVFSLLFAMAVSQTFLVFNDLDIFEEYWSDILQDVPLLEFFCCFLMVILWLWITRRKIIEKKKRL